VPLGFAVYYTVVLFIASEGVAFGSTALGYMKEGSGWLFGLAAGFIIQGLILRAFPPKLEPHSVGYIWLKLS
jgi:hypothetical protein